MQPTGKRNLQPSVLSAAETSRVSIARQFSWAIRGISHHVFQCCCVTMSMVIHKRFLKIRSLDKSRHVNRHVFTLTVYLGLNPPLGHGLLFSCLKPTVQSLTVQSPRFIAGYTANLLFGVIYGLPTFFFCFFTRGTKRSTLKKMVSVILRDSSKGEELPGFVRNNMALYTQMILLFKARGRRISIKFLSVSS